jgi:hypothetical protein
MSKRGVTSYGVPVDRRTTGNVPVPPKNETSASMGGTTAPASGGSGFNWDMDPLEYAKLVSDSITYNPTRLYGSSGGANASDVLARDKFNYERQQNAAAAQKQRDVLAAYQAMLSGGGYRVGADRMLGMIGQQGDASTEQVNQAYQTALQNIGAGYGDAQRLTGEGYSALEQFLRQNQNNPYAGVQVSAGQAPDAMEQILSAYGVSADPVRAQVAAEQAAAQQGAAGFQNLLNTLGASAQQSDASRLAEMMMAQNLAQTSLGSQRAGFESQAGRAQADALAQIQSQLAQSRLQQEAAAEQRRQEIEDAIAAAGGVIPSPAGSEEPTAPAAAQKPIDVLKARMETANPALKKKIEQFVAQNPRAGQKKIEQAFPKIASKMK